MEIQIQTRNRKLRVPPKKVKQVVSKCSSKLLPKKTFLSVAFLADPEMTRINEEYTGREGTTDVLSFPLGKNKRDGVWYGEIIISLDRANRQAINKRVSLTSEVIRLLVHSIAHLSGLDHHDKKGFKEMRRVEFYLLLECLNI